MGCLSIESLIALRTACVDHYSGQNSRGYRLLCKLNHAIGRRCEMPIHEYCNYKKIHVLYKEWVNKYSELL